ncbi:hypothetical protein [Streptomyces bicolor]|uniref:hypothetical protein n=1 Tax=Streptomyces bicolor TaxID=66874 RepID=UPI0004E1CD9C|nr:hypothetical protein [Streptomyces bicolor]
MSGTQGGAERRRGRTRWWVLAAVLALPGLAVAGFVAMVVHWAASDDLFGPTGPEPVACADALHFGGAELPDGAEPVGVCEVQGFQDIHYSATFRMPRADVGDWLTRTYPDAPAPETGSCGLSDADLCLEVAHPDGHPAAGAHAVQVSVEYESADTALVRFSAFTM